MIFDTIDRLGKYIAYDGRLALIEAFLTKNNAATLPLGNHSVGAGITANVSEYAPGEGGKFEAQILGTRPEKETRRYEMIAYSVLALIFVLICLAFRYIIKERMKGHADMGMTGHIPGMSRRRKTIYAWSFLAIAVMAVGVWQYYPLLRGSLMAFQDFKILAGGRFIGPHNFIEILMEKNFYQFLYQTFLYKYLALFEFKYLKSYGVLPLGLTWRAMPKGPVPVELYDKRHDPCLSNAYAFCKEQNANIIVLPGKSLNLDYFNHREIGIMQSLLEIYAQAYVTARLMSDASHEEIQAWRKTWARNPNGIIDASLEFSGNLYEKAEAAASFPEEVFLVNKGLESCSLPSET
jgi:predicted nucleic acid-binding Zn ribbon protein